MGSNKITRLYNAKYEMTLNSIEELSPAQDARTRKIINWHIIQYSSKYLASAGNNEDKFQ